MQLRSFLSAEVQGQREVCLGQKATDDSIGVFENETETSWIQTSNSCLKKRITYQDGRMKGHKARRSQVFGGSVWI